MKTKLLRTHRSALRRAGIIHSTNTLPSPCYLFILYVNVIEWQPFLYVPAYIKRTRVFHRFCPLTPLPVVSLPTPSLKLFPSQSWWLIGRGGVKREAMLGTRSCHREGPGAHAQREQPGPGAAGRPASSGRAQRAVQDAQTPSRQWEGGAHEGSVACGAGGHTHNFSIHSPSITSVQLEAVMGRTQLRSSGSAACSGPPSAAAATRATRSAVSSGPQRPPAMLGRGGTVLGRGRGERKRRARGLASPPAPAFPGSRRWCRAAPPPPGRTDSPSFGGGPPAPPLIRPGPPRPRPLPPRLAVARGVGCVGNGRSFFLTPFPPPPPENKQMTQCCLSWNGHRVCPGSSTGVGVRGGFLKRNTAANLKIHPLFHGSGSNKGLQSKAMCNEKTERCLAISCYNEEENLNTLCP